MKNRIYSTDSAKAIKAQGFGVINGIHYMAPHELGSHGTGRKFNLCSHASAGCISLCLGEFSGQAGMAKDGELNSVRKSRRDKAARFMNDRKAYMQDVALSTGQEYRRAAKKGFGFVARFNGSTDIAAEAINVVVDAALASKLSKLMQRIVAAGVYRNLMVLFPEIQFVDYTKNPLRLSRKLPANYSLTFSLAENNHAAALELLSRGVNVAAVFGGTMPAVWNGFTVINGDEHDLRHLDPTGPRGFIVGLAPKGRKAKKDKSGFVVWNHVETIGAEISAAA